MPILIIKIKNNILEEFILKNKVKKNLNSPKWIENYGRLKFFSKPTKILDFFCIFTITIISSLSITLNNFWLLFILFIPVILIIW